MGAFCKAMLLIAACLHCANSSATTVKEGEKKQADCSNYIIRPEDIKCFNQVIVEQMIKNITNATNEKINAMEERVRQLEKTVNSSQVRWQHICKLYKPLLCILPLSSLFIRSSGLSRLEEQWLPQLRNLSSVSRQWTAYRSLL